MTKCRRRKGGGGGGWMGGVSILPVSRPTHLEGGVGEEGESVPLEEPLAGVLKGRVGDGLSER